MISVNMYFIMCDTEVVSKYTVEIYVHGSGTWTTEFKTNVLIYFGTEPTRQDPALTNFLAGPLNKYHKY